MRGQTYDETCAEVGITYAHLMRLLREGRLRTAPDGGVEPASVATFATSYRPPPRHVTQAEASRRLGIALKHIPFLVRVKALDGIALPNANGGVFVAEDSLADLDMVRVAKLGIKIPPPDGWLSSYDACRILNVDRSGLRHLVKEKRIRQLSYSPMNTFYHLADVKAEEK